MLPIVNGVTPSVPAGQIAGDTISTIMAGIRAGLNNSSAGAAADGLTDAQSANTSSARSLYEMEHSGDVSQVSDTYGEDSVAYQLDAARRYNAEQAQLAYDRQRELRQTYYQDLIGSLKAAGLNPILAAGMTYSGGAAPQASTQAIGGDTYSDLINAASQRRNSTSKRIEAIASILGNLGSLLSGAGNLARAVKAD